MKGFDKTMEKGYNEGKANADAVIIPPLYHKPRLFVEMDGILVKFPNDEYDYSVRTPETSFFRNLGLYKGAVDAVKEIASRDECDVYILSCIQNSPIAVTERNVWLDEYLPEIDASHRLFCKIDEVKSHVSPIGVHKTDILWDSNNKNLINWQNEGGTAIRCPNGIIQDTLEKELWGVEVIANGSDPLRYINAKHLVYQLCVQIGKTSIHILRPGVKFTSCGKTHTVIGWVDGYEAYGMVCLREDGWKFTAHEAHFLSDGTVSLWCLRGKHSLYEAEQLKAMPDATYHVEPCVDGLGELFDETQAYCIVDKDGNPFRVGCRYDADDEGDVLFFDRLNESLAKISCYELNVSGEIKFDRGM